MKLSIAILTELCYTEGVQTFGFTGRFAFLNAVNQTQYPIVGKAPHVSGLTSRRTSEQLTAANVGRFVFQPQKARKMSHLSNSEKKRRNDMFVQGMLWCAGHKQFEPVKDFRKYNPKTRSHHTNYGYRFYCKGYETEVQNPNRADRSSKFAKERNTGLKNYWVELAGGKCQRCGFDEFVSALEFHHVYPALKKGEPSKLIFNNNKEKAWRELDKCCLLCSICHRTYKAREWRAEFIKLDGLGWTVGAELSLDDKRYETDKPPAYNQTSMPLFNYQQKNLQLALFDPPVAYVGVTL